VSDAYAAAGVDTEEAGRGVAELVEVLRAVDPGRSSLSLPLPGHYASVIRVAPNLGIALATDSVGSKVIIAEQLASFETIGIDCVAMNVNDLVCVGAEPLALLDYVAVERADAAMLRALAVGLRAGAELAGVEIPGGEVCQLPEVIRGHPSPLGFDLVGSAIGRVALDQIVDGSACRAGDAVLGLPASGVHSNGLTLARRALLEDGSLTLRSRPDELGGRSVGETLLEPTTIYVRAVLELLRGGFAVRGLAHITGDGVLNLLRLGTGIGYEVSEPLEVPPIFALIADRGGVSAAEMWEVFNMGCGFCAIVPDDQVDAALTLLNAHHPGARRIGTVTDRSGMVALPSLGLEGDKAGLNPVG
jgi:phosphoribosylformylglycinamidine cyclo-ligase